MELSASLYLHLSPVAVFLEDPDPIPFHDQSKVDDDSDWQDSSLNPRNRLDAFMEPDRLTWRLDGVCRKGTQFLVVPMLGAGVTIRRIDVFLPDHLRLPRGLRRAFGAVDCLAMSNKTSMYQNGLCQFVLQTLHQWSVSDPAFVRRYNALPFGSRIVIEGISTCVTHFRPRVLVTKQPSLFLSVGTLKNYWSTLKFVYPECIALQDIVQERQMSGSVGLITIPQKHGDQKFIFKCNVNEPRFLYHELRCLLMNPTHSNVVGRPLFLVCFGANCTMQAEDNICGFVVEYSEGGSLADVLDSQISMTIHHKLRWAIQILEALQHIMQTEIGFYSELRPHNIVLSQDLQSIKLIDLEQHANWETFSAPEIIYIDNIWRLSKHPLVPADQRATYNMVLKQHNADYLDENVTYNSPKEGYFGAWKGLDMPGRERAMIFSFGVTLWCIFEETSHPSNAIVDEYTCYNEVECPAFRRTPLKVRSVIQACLGGFVQSIDGSPGCQFYRVGNHVVHRDEIGHRGNAVATARGTWLTAKRLWRQHLSKMETYLDAKLRYECGERSGTDSDLLGYPRRPGLQEVADTLASILQDELTGSNIRQPNPSNACQKQSEY